MLTLLAITAVVAGATGSWSPCGLSMIATLGPEGHAGGRRATVAALAAFAPGALLGGVLTFGSLAVAGALLGGAGAAGTTAAAAVVLAGAALLELRGAPIVPQVRRQVPEPWRRVLPLPAAAAGYGVLLGLGFTTYVLTFALPALAATSVALGDPVAGLVIGLAFGAGRALPVLVLAPLAEHPAGRTATELMAQRPAVLRAFRAAAGLALAACAVVVSAGVA